MTTRPTQMDQRPECHPRRPQRGLTPPPARPFREVLGAGTSAVVNGAEQAVRSLPGGPILAAAFRPGAGTPAIGSTVAGQVPEGTDGTAQGSTGSSIETDAR